MAVIPKPPKNKVQSVTVTYDALLQRARGGPEEAYPTYIFGADRKTFWNTFQGGGTYDKPVVVNPDGTTTHLPDPDLVSQNP
jgi:hypothetical protein